MSYDYKSIFTNKSGTLGYTPGGFNLQGSTPGILPQPKPANNTPSFNPSDSSSYMSKMPVPNAPIKKTEHKDSQGGSTTIHYDVPKQDTPSTLNVKNKDGSYSSGSDIKVQGTNTSGQNLTDGQIKDNQPSEKTSPAPTFSGLLGDTSALAKGNIPVGNRAQEITDRYTGMINPLIKNQTGQMTGYATGMGTNPVAVGNAGIAEANIGKMITGLTNQESQELSGVGQQLTAQNQAQTGLGTAAGYAQPNATSQGQTTYDPLTNTFSGGSYPDNLNTVVQAVKSGKMGYTDGVNSLASLSPTAKADVLNALGQGFDTVSSDANAATRAGNIITAGTTPTTAAADVYKDTYNSLLTIKQATSNIDQFGNLLLKNMGDINPTDAKFANKTIAEVRNQLSSEQQATFDTTFAQLKAQIASLLSSGGAQIPTQITLDANHVIDGSAPLGTLTATLQRIGTEGRILTNQVENKLNTAGGVIGATKSGSNNNPAGI